MTSLGIDASRLSRLVRAAGEHVVRIGSARATQYAATREIRTFGHRWNTFRVNTDGEAVSAATLHALRPREWWYETVEPAPGWLHGAFSNGLFPDLPWFLDDLRPQGFLGRVFAHRHAEELGLGADPRNWDAAGVLSAFLLFGHELPGDFVIGDRMLERVQRARLGEPPCVDAKARPQTYPSLADAALAGDVAGTSAGGEQPKFTSCVRNQGTYRHVIVKFSPPRDTSAGERWADLLVCEHLAARTLRDNGIAAAETDLLEYGARNYLEVTRFDRVGPYGRRGLVTLFALDNAHHGKLDNWRAAADRLERDRWLNEEDAEMLRLLFWFNQLIRNSDLHFGNISFFLDRARPLRLAPAYDVLPMHYRPATTGEIVARDFVPALPRPDELSTWRRAAELASLYWQRISDDRRLSRGFRDEATRVLASSQRLRDRFP